MNYAFFEQLAEAEAHAYLATFLEEERKRIPPEWWERLRADGVNAIESYFAEFVTKIGLHSVSPPADLPAYIVESMERDHGGFREFSSDADRISVLAAAFYFGEAFRQSFDALSWSVGRPGRAEQGQPALTGFSSGSDLPVLIVTENLVLDYALDPSRVGTAIQTWTQFV